MCCKTVQARPSNNPFCFYCVPSRTLPTHAPNANTYSRKHAHKQAHASRRAHTQNIPLYSVVRQGLLAGGSGHLLRGAQQHNSAAYTHTHPNATCPQACMQCDTDTMGTKAAALCHKHLSQQQTKPTCPYHLLSIKQLSCASCKSTTEHCICLHLASRHPAKRHWR
jgi:hypothetical protein